MRAPTRSPIRRMHHALPQPFYARKHIHDSEHQRARSPCPARLFRDPEDDCQRGAATGWTRQGRSEEHTSELQSLMRISYAVFCLKKKKKINRRHHIKLISNKTYDKE